MMEKALRPICVFTLLFLSCLHSAVAVVQVSEMDDMALGSWSGTGNMTATDSICVYNSVEKDYYIKATTSTGSFVFSNGSQTVPFSIEAETIRLTYNTNEKLSNADTSSSSCSGSPNTRIDLTIQASDLFAATVSSAYQVVVYLTVVPI